MSMIPTPHNSVADPDAFGKTVLMPGDPLRAKFIAETFLTDPVLINNVRGVYGYVGTWQGVKVSVMASGMGMPSIGIYSWELFNFYNVENIIRVGSAGGIADELKLKDVVAGMVACTDSNYPKQFAPADATFSPYADYKLLTAAVEAGKKQGIDIKVGPILSSDHFYSPDWVSNTDRWKRMGVLATEMEAAALYTNAAYAGKRALALCTVSDHLYRPEDCMTAEERQTTLTAMITVALDTAVSMEQPG